MGAARYAFRVRGRASDEVVAALQEELEVEVEVEVDADRTSTAIKGWLPDQAALYGMLARIRSSLATSSWTLAWSVRAPYTVVSAGSMVTAIPTRRG